jgi:hypothetical protein
MSGCKDSLKTSKFEMQDLQDLRSDSVKICGKICRENLLEKLLT